MKKIFISYASQDSEVSEKISDILERKGVACWIAPRDVRPGHDYGEEIIRGISECSALVLMLSEHANASKFVKREVERAVSHGKPVLPLRLSDIEPSRALELFISGTHWIDVWTPPIEQYLDKLVTAIHALDPVESVPEQPTPAPQSDPAKQHPVVAKNSYFPKILVACLLLLAGAFGAWKFYPKLAGQTQKTNENQVNHDSSEKDAPVPLPTPDPKPDPVPKPEDPPKLTTGAANISSLKVLLGKSMDAERLALLKKNAQYIPEKISPQQFRELAGYTNFRKPESVVQYLNSLEYLVPRFPNEISYEETSDILQHSKTKDRSQLLHIIGKKLPSEISTKEFLKLANFTGRRDDKDLYLSALDLFYSRLPEKIEGDDFVELFTPIVDGQKRFTQIKRFLPRLDSLTTKNAQRAIYYIRPLETTKHWEKEITQLLLPKIIEDGREPESPGSVRPSLPGKVKIIPAGD